MYEYNKKAGLGSMVPIATRSNIPPRGVGMGWTGGFTIPGNEQQFSGQICSGPEGSPMDSSSDLVCGRSAEVDHLNSIGCRTVGFQGSHHCRTGQGNEGLFFCCPPGVLDAQMAGGGQASALPSGVLLGAAALLVAGIGWGLYDHMKKREEEEALLAYERY